MGWEFLSDLDKFFNPKSIAIIGASSNPSKLGYYPLFNCSKFDGKMYPVTLHSEEILGHKCYRNVKEIPDKIDLAIIILPSESVPDVVRDCGCKQIKNIII